MSVARPKSSHRGQYALNTGKFPTVLSQNEDRIKLYVACKEWIVRLPCFSVCLAFLWLFGLCTGLDQLQKGDTRTLGFLKWKQEINHVRFSIQSERVLCGFTCLGELNGNMRSVEYWAIVGDFVVLNVVIFREDKPGHTYTVCTWCMWSLTKLQNTILNVPTNKLFRIYYLNSFIKKWYKIKGNRINSITSHYMRNINVTFSKSRMCMQISLHVCAWTHFSGRPYFLFVRHMLVKNIGH